MKNWMNNSRFMYIVMLSVAGVILCIFIGFNLYLDRWASGNDGSRTEDMLAVCLALNPSQVWLMGAARGYMRRGLIRRRPDILVRTLAGPEELSIDQLAENQVIYAIGNIAQGGRELMARVRKEGTTLVS